MIDVPDLGEVVAAGDRRQSLEVIRNHLASELAESSGRDVAAIARELREVMKELDGLPVPEEVSGVDQLARRRATRRGAASA